MEIDGMEKQWKTCGSDVGPLSRTARVQQWESNRKIAVSMCDHYGVEARKENHGRNEQNRSYGATVGLVGGAFGYAFDTLR